MEHSVCIHDAIRAIQTTVSLFGFDRVGLSFNGGKDSTVLLHLVMLAFPEDYRKFTFVYFKQQNEFPEVLKFIQRCDKQYDLSLRYLESSFKEELAQLLDKTHIKAIFLGTRRGDPKSSSLCTFTPSDPGWPVFMRVMPILDWSYAQIWQFLKDKPYCVLYDENTRPNPLLLQDDDTYLPACMLENELHERSGRISSTENHGSSNCNDKYCCTDGHCTSNQIT
eukprot:gene592-3906_t